MRNLIGLKSALTGTVCALALTTGALADPKSIDIPAGNLKPALDMLIQQAGIQVIYKTDDVLARHTIGAHGTLEPEAALRQLVDGTGLSVRRDDSGVLVIVGLSPKNVQAASNDGAAQTGTIETVVVTGTHIAGAANETAPVITLDRAQIQDRGYTTTQQLIASIPQNSSGGAYGATEDGSFSGGFFSNDNESYATGVNLRGLGSSSTLVLINGHRIAPSAAGAFVDVSAISLSAIDRVDIMTDGASAIYGSDAVGGVVNFILRKDYSGQETATNFGTTTDGGRAQQTYNQVVGRDWDGGGGVLTLQYQHQDPLKASDRSFTDTAPEPTYLLPRSEMASALLNVHQQLSPSLDVSSDGYFTYQNRYEQRTSGGKTTISSPITLQGTGSVTLGYQIGDDWRADLTTSYSMEHTDSRFAQPITYPACVPNFCDVRERDNQWSMEGNINGTLFKMPGGDVKIAVGGSFLHEGLRVTSSLQAVPAFSQHDYAEYVELSVPLVSATNAMPFLQSLSLSLAARHDDYSDFGSTTNPRYGVAWRPFPELLVRGSYSTSFRAPNASDTVYAQSLPFFLIGFSVAAPSGGGTVPAFVLEGSKSPLQPETSSTASTGFDYEPEFVPGLKLSFDYFNISYHNRITAAPFDVQALLKPNLYGSLITAFPNAAAAQAYASNLQSLGAVFINTTTSPISAFQYALDVQQQNAALQKEDGLDLTAAYHFDLGAGTVNIDADMAYIDKIATAFVAGAQPINSVNTFGNPTKWRGRANLSWSDGPLKVSTGVNFTGAYADTTSLVGAEASPWTTLDMRVQYTIQSLHNLTVGLNATNLFDADPPTVVGFSPSYGVHYDPGNANPLGRIISLDAKIDW